MTLRRFLYELFAPAWEDLWSKAIRHAGRANEFEANHEWEQAIPEWHKAAGWLRAAYLAAPDINRRQLWHERAEPFDRIIKCAKEARDSWAAVECVRGRVA